MLKQKRQLFELLFIGTDLLVVTGAWLLAYWLRFGTDLIEVDKGIPAFRHYLSMVIFIWLIWAFVFKRMGLYRPMRGVRRTREMWMLINANALSVLMFIAVTFLFREKSVPFSRLVFLYFGVLASVFTIAQRYWLRSFLREIRRRGYNLRYMLVVGTGAVAADVVQKVRQQKELGIQLVGCLGPDHEEDQASHGLPVLGDYDSLGKIVRSIEIDQVVLALPIEQSRDIPGLMAQIGDTLVDVKIVPDLYRFISLGGYIEEFEGLPVISVQESPMNLVAKRVVDVMLSIALIIAFSPLMLLIALIIKCSSRGPVFYRQERVSYDGSGFSILKFRTMAVDAERGGPGWTTPGDSRVTPFGRFLRSSSLDELPQLFNVLAGDMSIVGPRPERPVFIKQFRTRVPRYMLRHKVPAGMTGWAQVHGWRGNTSIDKRIEFDLYYIENWSLLLDFKILFLTLLRGFKNTNAY